MRLAIFLYLFLLLLSCSDKNATKETDHYAKDALINGDQEQSNSPMVKERLRMIETALKNKTFISYESSDSLVLTSQEIIRGFRKLNFFILHPRTKEPCLTEMFGIEKATSGSLPPKHRNIPNLYLGYLYNYASNSTLRFTIDPLNNRIINVEPFRDFQPDLNPYHEKLAIDIATHSSLVEKALGFSPTKESAMMAATKTALNKSKCERSFHVCCAPTFTKDQKALWSIVDLTNLRVIGVRWTNLGENNTLEYLSQRKLLIDKVEECNCSGITPISKMDWKLDYELTRSDGLKISDVFYNGTKILDQAKVVDWHVSYSNSDGFGYSDAIGCPSYSHAAVTAVNEAKVSEMEENDSIIGFVLEQQFMSKLWPAACNYSYVQRFEFYKDGRFRVATGSLGRGCGTDGTYRPVTRIQFAGENHRFSEWNDNKWKVWKKEQFSLQAKSKPVYLDKYQYQIADLSFKYYMELGNGQFNDGGRGDNAYTYITKMHSDKDEGEADLMTIGPCCNTNYEQGPEKFINNPGELIDREKTVLWYVSQLHNDGAKGSEYCWAESYLENGVFKTKAYPCISGPQFVPVK